jgi:hypothetical protein
MGKNNMKKELEEKIFKDFPEFFKHKKDMHKSLMGFGIACGDGWYTLVYDLCRDIKNWYENNESHHIIDEEYNTEIRKGIPDHFEVVQVKEKFGGLRFYILSAPQVIHDMIRRAENDSYFICERCGKDVRKQEYNDGKYHSYYRDQLGWVQTLCDSCLQDEIKDMGLPEGSYVSDWQKKNSNPFKEVK